MTDDDLLTFAIQQKPLAECARDQVVCVIAGDFPEIFIGYNRTPPGVPSCFDGGCPRGALSYADLAPGGDYSNCLGVHAEPDAVAQLMRASLFPKSYWSDVLPSAVAVVTREPCSDCWTLFDTTGIPRVVWLANDGTTRAREL